jgi:hypothetical protein
VAALEASGRDLIELGIFDVGLPSLFGLSVLNILPPFFSGDGVLDFFSSGAGDSVDVLIVCVRLLIRVAVFPELFRDAIEGRVGSGGGLERSLCRTGGIDPNPSHSDEAFVSAGAKGTPCGGGVGASTSAPDERLSLDSSLLFFKASSRSTRSLHCSSSCRNDSSRALSVSDAGR